MTRNVPIPCVQCTMAVVIKAATLIGFLLVSAFMGVPNTSPETESDASDGAIGWIPWGWGRTARPNRRLSPTLREQMIGWFPWGWGRTAQPNRRLSPGLREQIQLLSRGDSAWLCEKEEGGWWNYFKKKLGFSIDREQAGVIINQFCKLQRHLAEAKLGKTEEYMVAATMAVFKCLDILCRMMEALLDNMYLVKEGFCGSLTRVWGLGNNITWWVWPQVAMVDTVPFLLYCLAVLYDWAVAGVVLAKNLTVLMTSAFIAVIGWRKSFILEFLDLGIYLYQTGSEMMTRSMWLDMVSGIMIITAAYSTVRQVLKILRLSGTDDLTPEAMAKAMAKMIGEDYVPLKCLGASSDIREFRLYSKATKQNVFMRYLRGGATKRARIKIAREGRMLGQLRHPNIISLIGCLRAGNAFGLALEFARHGDLAEAMGKYMYTNLLGVSLANKLSIFRQVVEAVEYLHSSHIAHLNLRPQSVLVFHEWSLIKLSAFGRAVNVPHRIYRCRRFDLHVDCSPSFVMVHKKPYNPYKMDTWALWTLLLFILTGSRYDPLGPSPVPKILTALDGHSAKYQAATLGLVRWLFSVKEQDRPASADIRRELDEIDRIQTP